MSRSLRSLLRGLRGSGWADDVDNDAAVRAWVERAVIEGRSDEEIADFLADALRSPGNEMGDTMARLASTEARQHEKIRKGFEKRLQERWARPLDLLTVFLVACIEVGEEWANARHERAAAADEDDLHAEVLIRLHVRGCLVASEALALLRTGHAGGAMTRARTLHELAVTSAVLLNAGPADAARYARHHAWDRWKRARDFQAVAHEIGEEPFSDKEMVEFEDDVAQLAAEYGRGIKSDWGWAASILRPGDTSYRPSFRDLEAHAGLQHYRAVYSWFSESVHAGAKSTGEVYVERGPHAFYAAGPSNDGLADPAHQITASLGQLTGHLILVGDRRADDVMTVYGLQRLRATTDQAFTDVQLALDDEELRAIESLEADSEDELIRDPE